jgi:hypothetical protein
MPVSSGECPTSVGRPSLSSGAEDLTGPATSGSVPVVVHGCSALCSSLHSGEEEGLDCNFRSFSNVLSTNARDPYVNFYFMGSFVIVLYLHCYINRRL